MNRQKTKNLPRILFAAPSSGSGKTVITCGFLEILQRRNISCVSFKCGPDYIDPMFHRYVLGVPGYNLDSFFLPPESVKELFIQKARKMNISVIEGVMGYYDGVAGITSQASAYEIARITDTPVVLVVDGKKSSLSLAALVKGFIEYEPDSRIRGVILNRTSAMMAERLRPCLESLGIRLYGAVPECEEAKWESRHLGLTLPGEQKKLREKVEDWADRLENCLNIDGLLKLAEGAAPIALDDLAEGAAPIMLADKDNGNADMKKSSFSAHQEKAEGKNTGKKSMKPDSSGNKEIRRIAIARDEAFCFYYQENLELLEHAGWELVPFSPLHDKHLPSAGISAILLGGGYPEVYAKELSENHAMLKEIRIAKQNGIKFLAECGGFLYLHEWLEGTDGTAYPMVGLIKAKGYRTEKLSRFGYIVLYNQQGQRMFRAHEFHYWDTTLLGGDWQAVKPLSTRKWNGMIVTDEMIAGFPHLYYGSNPEEILRFLSHVALS